MKKRSKIILFSIIAIFLILFISRFLIPSEIDDLNPHIYCDQKYLDKASVVWVIPDYQKIPISNNKTWCNWILSLNKTIGMHGITHSYHEFLNPINQSQLDYGKQIFKECFGFEPTIFKPPYLRISKQNKELIKENNMTLKWYFNQDTRKVYHCENSGTFPNWFHKIF